MVQKSRTGASRLPKKAAAKTSEPSTKRRGRPRAYEPEQALGRALDLFRQSGFAATSLDELSAATGMNRPSLYGAFGDKRELYMKSLERYRADARALLAEAFTSDLPLRPRLLRIYDVALDIYLSGKDGPRGCFTVMTAASDAVADPEIRAMVQAGLGELDKAFIRLLQQAKDRGELSASVDPQILGQLAAAAVHTLSVRARAGTPRAELEAIARGAVDLIAG